MNLFNNDMLTWLLFMVRKTEHVLHQTSDITITQYRILQQIKRQENKLDGSHYAIKTLASKLSLTPAAVTTAVKELEQRQLLKRSNDEQDGRGITLEATEKSKVFLKDTDNMLINLIKDFLTPVKANDIETIVRSSVSKAYNRGALRVDAGRARVDIAYVEVMLDSYNTLRNVAAIHGLTFPKALVILFLADNVQPMSRSEIAKLALLPYNNVSQIVASLKGRGYLQYCLCEDERKISLVIITPEGSKLAQTLTKDFNAAMLNEIYHQPNEEHEMFVRACRAIVERERLHYV